MWLDKVKKAVWGYFHLPSNRSSYASNHPGDAHIAASLSTSI